MATNGSKKKITRKHAGIKALRQTKKRLIQNTAKRISLQIEERLLKKALQNSSKEEAQEILRTYQKKFAKAAKIGVIHKNKAKRSTSRAMMQFNKKFAK